MQIYINSDLTHACVLENYTVPLFCYARMMLILSPILSKKYMYYFLMMLIIPPLPSQNISSSRWVFIFMNSTFVDNWVYGKTHPDHYYVDMNRLISKYVFFLLLLSRLRPRRSLFIKNNYSLFVNCSRWKAI